MKIALTGAGGLVGQRLQQHWARTFATAGEVRALLHGDLASTGGAALAAYVCDEEPC